MSIIDPYEILGISKDSSENQLQKRYEGLRDKYSDERFLEGDAGAEAARKLMELEDAWVMIKADLARAAESKSGDFGQVEQLIKSGRLEDAQTAMDNITVRTAEWHYLQSVIYYKREWLTESRAQLALAVSMDPNNIKYSDALRRMDSIMGSPRVDPNSFGNSDAQFRQSNNDMGNTLCRCCQIYCCIDCLCSMCQICMH